MSIFLQLHTLSLLGFCVTLMTGALVLQVPPVGTLPLFTRFILGTGICGLVMLDNEVGEVSDDPDGCGTNGLDPFTLEIGEVLC